MASKENCDTTPMPPGAPQLMKRGWRYSVPGQYVRMRSTGMVVRSCSDWCPEPVTQLDLATMADPAQRRIHSKIPRLEQALIGGVRDHHRQLLAMQLAHIPKYTCATAPPAPCKLPALRLPSEM